MKLDRIDFLLRPARHRAVVVDALHARQNIATVCSGGALVVFVGARVGVIGANESAGFRSLLAVPTAALIAAIAARSIRLAGIHYPEPA